MQYALMGLDPEKDVFIIIDANEYKELIDSKDKKIADIEPDDNELILKLVYGTIIPQYKIQRKDIEEGLNTALGKALAYVDNGVSTLIELVDIEVSKEEINDRIPFSALIRTNLTIDNKKHQAISAFLRYGNMTVQDNLLNRFGIFAIKEQENRIKEQLSKDNWKTFIDENRVLRVASKII